jgi:GTPase SAR1 family protein
MLIGPSNCGKTTTIDRVYEEVYSKLEEPPKEYIIKERTPIGSKDSKDFEAILKYEGQEIGFYSLGDYASMVINDAMKAYDGNCDVLVCACNERFLSPPGYAIRRYKEDFIPVFKKYVSETDRHDSEYEKYASIILQLIADKKER